MEITKLSNVMTNEAAEYLSKNKWGEHEYDDTDSYDDAAAADDNHYGDDGDDVVDDADTAADQY